MPAWSSSPTLYQQGPRAELTLLPGLQHRPSGATVLHLPPCVSPHWFNQRKPVAKSLQSCLTLCDPRDGSPPRLPSPWDSPGKNTGVGCHFLQCVKVKSLSCVRLFATPWTAAHQAPLSMGFSRQEYWSGVPLPSLLLS